MKSERLKAFTDGVIAIIITIMVLELRPPHGADIAALRSLAPVFLSYLLSFVYVAIYWNNHHHFFALTHRVNGAVMWANMHLLFWMSLIPFATAWHGEHLLQPGPAALYGAVLMACAVAWAIMQRVIIAHQGPDSPLKRAIGRDWKGRASPVLYATGIAVAFVHPIIADIIYAGVAAMWLVPDSRVAHAMDKD